MHQRCSADTIAEAFGLGKRRFAAPYPSCESSAHPQGVSGLRDASGGKFKQAANGAGKAMSIPTTIEETVTSSTPYGKMEASINPLELYLTLGGAYIASGYSSKPRDLAGLIKRGMEHDGFSIVHVASPCTTYNGAYAILKGDKAKGIEGTAWDLPADHDPSSRSAALGVIDQGGVPLGVVYESAERPSLDRRIAAVRERVMPKSPDALLSAYAL